MKTNLIEIIKNKLIRNKIKIYKSTLNYNGITSIQYYLDLNMSRYVVNYEPYLTKIISVEYMDGDYDLWPAIEITTESNLKFKIYFDESIEIFNDDDFDSLNNELIEKFDF